jgi:putative NADH-flavin reductase
MRIALFGATGMIGSRIAQEALWRGHQVTAISPGGTVTVDGADAETGDLADPGAVTKAAGEHDVIVSATGPSRTGESHQPWLAATQNLIDHAGATRIVFVGGAGSLRLPDGTRLLDSEGFPEEYLPEARTGAAALDLFRAPPDSLDWTFLSPAPVIAPGERNGSYRVGQESPVGSEISAEDYAVALVDELEHPRHRRQRFTVAA